MTTAEKDIHPVDIHVGRRFRLARITMGFSQIETGQKLGLSFQQIQKYESGFNRISASRLFEMSVLTGYPIDWFFDGLDRGGMPLRDAQKNLISASEWEVLTALRALPKDMRGAITELVCVLPEER